MLHYVFKNKQVSVRFSISRPTWFKNIIPDNGNNYGSKNEYFAYNTSPGSFKVVVGKPEWMRKKINQS